MSITSSLPVLSQTSGLATQVVLRREFHVFGDARFEHLSGISASHIYNMRGSRTYRIAAHGGREDEGGDGVGKRQLILSASAPVFVMSLLESRTGHLTNLSAAPEPVWRGLTVPAESRCAGNPYDRDDYGSRYRSKEDDIIEDLGAIYGPYTGRCFESDQESTIEHIVAIHEAHTSGLCTADIETKRTFAGDLLNLTLAAGDVNSAKSNLDAFDWLPEKNQCWFAQRVVDVRLKYGTTVDRAEAGALERVLSGCESTELVKEACAQ